MHADLLLSYMFHESKFHESILKSRSEDQGRDSFSYQVEYLLWSTHISAEQNPFTIVQKCTDTFKSTRVEVQVLIFIRTLRMITERCIFESLFFVVYPAGASSKLCEFIKYGRWRWPLMKQSAPREPWASNVRCSVCSSLCQKIHLMNCTNVIVESTFIFQFCICIA